MPYVWDSVPSYRLRQADVNNYLKNKFGYYEFYLQVTLYPCPPMLRDLSDGDAL